MSSKKAWLMASATTEGIHLWACTRGAVGSPRSSASSSWTYPGSSPGTWAQISGCSGAGGASSTGGGGGSFSPLSSSVSRLSRVAWASRRMRSRWERSMVILGRAASRAAARSASSTAST